MVTLMVGKVGFDAETIPLGGEDAFPADRLESSPHAPDTGEQINEAEIPARRLPNRRGSTQSLQCGPAWRTVTVFPAIDRPLAITEKIDRIRYRIPRFPPQSGKIIHSRPPLFATHTAGNYSDIMAKEHQENI
nr:hypothetical protein [Oceanibaculum nanhaiense]